MNLFRNFTSLLLLSQAVQAFILPAPVHKSYHHSLKMATSTANSPTTTVNRNMDN